MAFEKTEGSIVALRNKPSVSVNEMLGLVVCAVRDCFNKNRVNDVAHMSVADPRQMVLSLNAIASMLLQAANENANAFTELKDSMRQNIEATISELSEVGNEYDRTSKDIKEMVDEEKKLEQKKAELEAETREYARIKKECDKLRDDIAALSDADIDEIKAERDKLAEELTERRNRKNHLDGEVSQLQTSLKETDGAVRAAEALRADIKNRIVSSEQEKKRLEDVIAKLKTDLDEAEKWIREFPEIHKTMLEESKRHETMMAQLRTSMNGIFSDRFLAENLFSKTGKPEKLTPENYPDLNVVSGKINSVADLQIWADGLMKRIQSLIAIYQEELKRLVECGDSIAEIAECGQ